VARYHSLHGLKDHMPAVLRPLAYTEDGCVMALEHTELPYAAVQFHPESILTDPKVGLTILANCLKYLKHPAAAAGSSTATAAAASINNSSNSRNSSSSSSSEDEYPEEEDDGSEPFGVC
jgi:Glutamine amidotransferase class-I